MFEMSVIVINVIDVFGSVSRLAWAVGKGLGAILGCPGAILGRFGSVLEPSGRVWEPSWDVLRPSWALLGCLRASWCHIGFVLCRFEAIWGNLGLA